MEYQYMSREGHEKMKANFEHLISTKRKEIAERIESARQLGDLKENSEYHAAKEEQQHLERKIGELSNILSHTRILDTLTLPKDKVCIGATVRIKDLKYDEVIQYKLVAEAEANYDENKISISSPVGRGLIGLAINESVSIKVPSGMLEYQVLEISC